MQADVRGLLDAANEISRHALGQPVGADQHVHVTTRAGEEDRCLACRITTLGLQMSGGIVDAAAKKTRKVGNVGHPVLRAAGDETDRGGSPPGFAFVRTPVTFLWGLSPPRRCKSQ